MSENRNLIFDKILKAKNKNFYWDKIFELRKFVDPEMINKCFSLINSKEDNFKIISLKRLLLISGISKLRSWLQTSLKHADSLVVKPSIVKIKSFS